VQILSGFWYISSNDKLLHFNLVGKAHGKRRLKKCKHNGTIEMTLDI
jgi:hypothetical protein